jgi:ABC-type uncharacterized transport system permease subunit
MANPPKGLKTVGKAVTERVLGEGPGPFRAALAAAITGGATAALTYHLLRHTGEDA